MPATARKGCLLALPENPRDCSYYYLRLSCPLLIGFYAYRSQPTRSVYRPRLYSGGGVSNRETSKFFDPRTRIFVAIIHHPLSPSTHASNILMYVSLSNETGVHSLSPGQLRGRSLARLVVGLHISLLSHSTIPLTPALRVHTTLAHLDGFSSRWLYRNAVLAEQL